MDWTRVFSVILVKYGFSHLDFRHGFGGDQSPRLAPRQIEANVNGEPVLVHRF
mgnify:CR=1 FL=1